MVHCVRTKGDHQSFSNLTFTQCVHVCVFPSSASRTISAYISRSDKSLWTVHSVQMERERESEREHVFLFCFSQLSHSLSPQILFAFNRRRRSQNPDVKDNELKRGGDKSRRQLNNRNSLLNAFSCKRRPTAPIKISSGRKGIIKKRPRPQPSHCCRCQMSPPITKDTHTQKQVLHERETREREREREREFSALKSHTPALPLSLMICLLLLRISCHSLSLSL